MSKNAVRAPKLKTSVIATKRTKGRLAKLKTMRVLHDQLGSTKGGRPKSARGEGSQLAHGRFGTSLPRIAIHCRDRLRRRACKEDLCELSAIPYLDHGLEQYLRAGRAETSRQTICCDCSRPLLADCVAKVASCRAMNFSRKPEAESNRRFV